MRVILTHSAEKDLKAILRATRRMFGDRQVTSYATILRQAFDLVAHDPFRPSTRAREELAPGLRSIHLQAIAGRRGGASHVLFYAVVEDTHVEPAILVVRVLHEAMEPKGRVG